MKEYFERQYDACIARGLSETAAAESVANALLDGKPSRKPAAPATERHAAFWSASFFRNLPVAAWNSEPMVLCLARYLALDGKLPTEDLLARVASVAPAALQRAARYSGLVLKQSSRRWREFEDLALTHPDTVEDFVQVFRIFDDAHRLRIHEVNRSRSKLADLTPLEVLSYASLYAFAYLVPAALGLVSSPQKIETQAAWDAINDILAWKLQSCEAGQLELDYETIGRSLRAHLSPYLFPSNEAPLKDLLAAFAQAIDDQIELNSFLGQSIDAFCFEVGIRFVRHEDRLEIVELDPNRNDSWHRENEKLGRLHQYWIYRGMNALMASPELLARVGTSNVDANLQAFAKAKGTWQRLQDVYGISDTIATESGAEVDGFRALLATELMTVFYIVDFLQPFADKFTATGDPMRSLGQLAFEGLKAGGEMQNRFPLTWSDRQSKISRIKAWTVSEKEPWGSSAAAEAILEFWTSDWCAMAVGLKSGSLKQTPDLFERPVLRLGSYLFQLPWMMAIQNNSTAAINSLRRLGARRAQAQEETQRIEHRLGQQFALRGFNVVTNYMPASEAGEDEAGEIDLVCASDGQVIVLEVKSTFVRRSVKEAWIYRTSTLRKAGLQIDRKVKAVQRALANDAAFRTSLGLHDSSSPSSVIGWIADTSIEFDHERFNGYLKVSIEELLIALRDDRKWLNDPQNIFGSTAALVDAAEPNGSDWWTLYPKGFSTSRFTEIIERELVWER